MNRVAGRVVVVTGAARGQGAADAQALAAEGATVIAGDIAETPDWQPSDHLLYRRLDVTDPVAWQALSRELSELYGAIGGLVNNAGITHRARLADVALDDWDRVLRVNVSGAMLGIQTLFPLMPAGASIVNICSLAGLTGHYPAAYTVSKWALRGLSRVASAELGPRGIRVNTIFPGFVETPMTASAPAAFRAASVEAAALGRVGTVEDIAPLVVYLISSESSFVSGAEIAVDGGTWAHGGAKALADSLA